MSKLELNTRLIEEVKHLMLVSKGKERLSNLKWQLLELYKQRREIARELIHG